MDPQTNRRFSYTVINKWHQQLIQAGSASQQSHSPLLKEMQVHKYFSRFHEHFITKYTAVTKVNYHDQNINEANMSAPLGCYWPKMNMWSLCAGIDRKQVEEQILPEAHRVNGNLNEWSSQFKSGTVPDVWRAYVERQCSPREWLCAEIPCGAKNPLLLSLLA